MSRKLFLQVVSVCVAGFWALSSQAYVIDGGAFDGADVGGLDVFEAQVSPLANSDPATEEAWAEGILGTDLVFSDKTEPVDYFATDTAGVFAFMLQTDPGYFIVKNARWWALFENVANTAWGVIDIGALNAGFNLGGNCGENDCEWQISHVTEFNGSVTVPEPSGAILFLLGLAGLLVARRKV